ncbi:MAG: hypothetical protein IJI68_05590 [Eggerthellaceae bacterium]|nr:hypothetical protein [Eggerthellaceae bacterium]
MLQIFEDYLFTQGYFVASPEVEKERASLQVAAEPQPQSEVQTLTVLLGLEHALEALIALKHFAMIHITVHPELASIDMLDVAKRNLGFNVPLPFYRGFPQSVRELSPFELYLDQVFHYFHTYGLGDFSKPGHSVFEEYYGREPFAENVEPKEFAIVTSDEAQKLLARMAEGFIASSRPLNDTNYKLLKAYLEEHSDFPAQTCACKDTAARLIIDTRDPELSRLMKLSDVIRLVEWLIELDYDTEKVAINKLNLKNRDRKLITKVLDNLFESGYVDTKTCLEKKRAWNGLLHHLHYEPKCAKSEEFCHAIRTKDQRSVYSAMEKCLAVGDVRGAVDVLHKEKGAGAVLRHLDYLLSSCKTDEDVRCVLNACETTNKIILVQLLLKYGAYRYAPNNDALRTFLFVRFGKLRVHRETNEEHARRKINLPSEIGDRMASWLLEQLKNVCRGTLGKVYVDESMRNIALPLQESASMGGFGTLPRGTRIPIPEGKVIRAFTYWEKVDDIDLSCLALSDDYNIPMELSWRTAFGNQDEAFAFSGDETSGYEGGSEYVDINIPDFLKKYGTEWHYVVFCDNIYSDVTFDSNGDPVSSSFDKCVCRAGYMLRDALDSGEVFEPATVQTSFVVNCASRAAYLFAIDLHDPALIWLNLGENSWRNIAGEGDVTFLKGYFHTIDLINLYDFAKMLATEVVDDPAEADVVFSDEFPAAIGPDETPEPGAWQGLREGQELIRSCDTARLLELLN